MFTLGLQRRFVAQHRMVGGDWGPENDLHSHAYLLEITLEGATLDKHGFLVDLDDLDRQLEGLIGQYRDQTLNDLPAFGGLNPSLENFARILCRSLAAGTRATGLSAVNVRLWENESAWAAFREAR
jgi:6-pyruvoyltetrahydropterin/6-carboxytetrahydropterin synthase